MYRRWAAAFGIRLTYEAGNSCAPIPDPRASVTKRLPYTIWLYVAIVVAVIVSQLMLGGIDSRGAGGVVTLVVATVGLVLARWYAWAFLTLIAAADLLIYAPAHWPAWWNVLINGPMLILLLLRPTRRYLVRPRPLRPA